MKAEKVKKKGNDWKENLICSIVANFFIYMHVYVKNFMNPKIHVFGVLMSVVAFIYLPNPHIAGCTNTEWFLLLIPPVLICSALVSSCIFVKLNSRTEAKQTLHNENPQPDQYYAGSNNWSNQTGSQNYAVEEGIEEITQLPNGGFRRVYKVRRS